MYTKPITALKNATGRIDYTLMNDYMFHRVMQECEKRIKGIYLFTPAFEPRECAMCHDAQSNCTRREDYR